MLCELSNMLVTLKVSGGRTHRSFMWRHDHHGIRLFSKNGFRHWLSIVVTVTPEDIK